MTKNKRVLSFILVMLMVISLLPTFALADSDSSAEQPVWPEEGSIRLEKDAQAVAGEDNLWEVTLGIQGKNYKTTSDVVLVIDNSNSMHEDGRMDKTKVAANAFVKELLTEGSTTRIALVVYATDVRSYTKFYGAAEKSQLIDKINAISKESNNKNGGTNQQAGIHKAQDLLNGSTAGLKNIVILSDGAPTFSYQLTGTAHWTGCSSTIIGHFWRGKYEQSTVKLTGCDYNTQLGDGTAYKVTGNLFLTSSCDHGKTRTDDVNYWYSDAHSSSANHGVATIWEAEQVKAADTTVYSVALQADEDGAYVMSKCATDSAKGYFAIAQNETDVSGKLKNAFTAIAGSIAIAAKNGVVNDTMGDKVQLSFSGAAPVITNDKAVYDAGNADVYISQGKATYDAATRSINWTVGNVSEGDNPTMKYKVTVRDGVTVTKGESLLTNEQATFTYTNYQDQPNTLQFFPKPEVTVGGGKILVHYYLVNAQGRPINKDGVEVGSPSLADQVKDAEYFSENGSNGLDYKTYTVSKQDINGYTYFGKYNLNNGDLTAGDVAPVTLTAANSNQHVWFAYTQSFTVAHVQNGKVVGMNTFPVQKNFDLTKQVPDGYLYGGAFSDAACDAEHVQNFTTGENALDFTPKAGDTYYIWEVDQKYLTPATFCTWYTNADSQREVTGLYLLTPLDRTLYREAGFTIGADSFKSEKDGKLLAYGDITVKYTRNPSRTDLLYLSNGLMRQDVNYDGEHTSYNKDSGYIAVYPLTSEQFEDFTTKPFAFQPYWITLDGVKVTGIGQRTCKYNQAPADKIGANDRVVGTKVTAAGTAAQAAPMMVAATYTLFGDQGSTAPVQKTVTITINDNGNCYDINANCGDVTGQVTYAGAAGKVFAGWYADEACTTPADLTDVQADMTIYAKYVSDSYLRVKYTQTGLFRARSVSLVAAVDAGTDYTDSGFIINGKEVSVKDYSTRYGLLRAQTLFGRGVDKNALLMTTRYTLSGMSYGDTLEVAPYWVTPDGTTVTGEARTLTYGRFGLKG